MRVSKINKILKEKNKLFQAAHHCNFFKILEKDTTKAYDVLFDKLGLSTFYKNKTQKRNAQLKIRIFFEKNTEVSFLILIYMFNKNNYYLFLFNYISLGS